jgi:hypothetical protein
MRRVAFVVSLVVALSTAACGRPFDVKTAPGFVEVKEESSAYDFRAVAPDGVAVAVRSVKIDDKTNLAFWESAVMLRTRELDGYAKLSASDVKSSDGTPGREIVFGHDEQGKPYLYRVRIFVNGTKLVMAEAGGSVENMDRWKSGVDWMLSTVTAN